MLLWWSVFAHSQARFTFLGQWFLQNRESFRYSDENNTNISFDIKLYFSIENDNDNAEANGNNNFTDNDNKKDSKKDDRACDLVTCDFVEFDDYWYRDLVTLEDSVCKSCNGSYPSNGHNAKSWSGFPISESEFQIFPCDLWLVPANIEGQFFDNLHLCNGWYSRISNEDSPSDGQPKKKSMSKTVKKYVYAQSDIWRLGKSSK